MSYDHDRYMELRSRRVPRLIALAMASDPEETAVVEPITIPPNEDALVAIDALAEKINEVIVALGLEDL